VTGQAPYGASCVAPVRLTLQVRQATGVPRAQGPAAITLLRRLKAAFDLGLPHRHPPRNFQNNTLRFCTIERAKPGDRRDSRTEIQN
jgi:hypothetical protein